jgi:hypothetical protein
VITARNFHNHGAKEPGVKQGGMNSATDSLTLNNQPLQNPGTYSDEDEVRRMEYQWGEAFERKDLPTLDQLMADEYILTDPLGTVIGSFNPRFNPRYPWLPAAAPAKLRGKFQRGRLNDLAE